MNDKLSRAGGEVASILSVADVMSNQKVLSQWQVYMIYCSDTSYYTGISTDALKRFSQHANQVGAKYFRGRRPERLVYLELDHSRSSASKRERSIKNLARLQKIALLSAESNQLQAYLLTRNAGN